MSFSGKHRQNKPAHERKSTSCQRSQIRSILFSNSESSHINCGACVSKPLEHKRRNIASPWGNEDTQTLIDILDRYGVKATFFVVGQWADKYPESVKALSDAGHEVMCHSDDHAHFNSLSAQEIIDDVSACCDKIETITGRRPTLFRPPFGEYDDHVVATLRGMGMEVIQWDVEALAAGARGRQIVICYGLRLIYNLGTRNGDGHGVALHGFPILVRHHTI